MTVETYGPADLYVVAFPSEHVPGQIREAVLTTLSSGVITLLDLVLVRRAADGSTEVLEIESLGEEFDLDLVQTVFEGHDLKTAVVDPAGSGIPLGPDMYPDLIRSVGTALASCN